MRRGPDRGGDAHHPRKPSGAVLSSGACIGMPPARAAASAAYPLIKVRAVRAELADHGQAPGPRAARRLGQDGLFFESPVKEGPRVRLPRCPGRREAPGTWRPGLLPGPAPADNVSLPGCPEPGSTADGLPPEQCPAGSSPLRAATRPGPGPGWYRQQREPAVPPGAVHAGQAVPRRSRGFHLLAAGGFGSVRCRPARAGALLVPGGEHLRPDYQPGDEIDEDEQEDNFPDGLVIGRGGVRNKRNSEREKDGRDEPPCAPRDCPVRRLPGPRPCGPARRPGPALRGGEVGGERGQLGAGPRGECLARPQVQLLPS